MTKREKYFIRLAGQIFVNERRGGCLLLRLLLCFTIWVSRAAVRWARSGGQSPGAYYSPKPLGKVAAFTYTRTDIMF